ncbi:MAG TPA: NAD(P)/FAD-dependent oxidoreductase [Nocardioides sp.]|nr:NAD(P)/FAD-dependent oxidoreductase [Nocardioides sp.]
MTGVNRHDVVIIGGGHNGLVAAFYLARAGLKPLVLERRPFVGGACVTEEFAPGYHASTGAYVLAMLRPQVWRDLQLERRGITVSPAGPTLNLLPDGTPLLLGDDPRADHDAVAHFSRHDAEALGEFEAELGRLAQVLLPTMDMPAPDPSMGRLRDWTTSGRIGRTAVSQRRQLAQTLQLLVASAGDYLVERFDNDLVRAALGWHAINDSLVGPFTPGTGYVLLHDHASGDPEGGIRQWGFVNGGMGKVTAAMADAAREAGATVRTDAQVASVKVHGDRAVGVVLEGGEEIDAETVVSNADPKLTFLSLCRSAALPPDFVRHIENFRCEGSSMKINVALAELPRIVGDRSREVQPYHRGILEIGPPLETLDLQQAQARRGVAGTGTHVEICFPTVHDSTLAPEGQHIGTIDVNSQPYNLASGSWDDHKDEVADRVIGELGDLMPNLPGAITHRQVLSPLDLERVLGLTGGHALHGEMTLDQLFVFRPALHYSDYRTPLDGLYLCGAGTHPGGGVTGANGRNCAAAVIADRRRSRRRLPGLGGSSGRGGSGKRTAGEGAA